VGLQASLIGYMVSSFFASTAYLWYVYYLVGYAVCLRRMYEAEHGPPEESPGGGAQQEDGPASEARGRAEAFPEPEAGGRLVAE
jgi:hypothetical protein